MTEVAQIGRLEPKNSFTKPHEGSSSANSQTVTMWRYRDKKKIITLFYHILVCCLTNRLHENRPQKKHDRGCSVNWIFGKEVFNRDVFFHKRLCLCLHRRRINMAYLDKCDNGPLKTVCSELFARQTDGIWKREMEMGNWSVVWE